jgi:D-3-phosphoglycerate dehydrogenase
MMRIAVPCHSFCRNEVLRRELLDAFPDVKFNDDYLRFDEDGLIEWLAGCNAAIVSLETVSEKVLTALPELKVFSNYGVGLDNFDPAAMKKHQVRLGWTAGVNRLSVAELALSFAIAGVRHVTALNTHMRGGKRPGQRIGRLLSGRVVGIHGCGYVGKELVRLLRPFDCRILACDIVDHGDFYRKFDVTPVDFDALVDRAEVLSLHLPLNGTTRGLYDADVLARLRPDCVLINTCRGGIVDETALKAVLAGERIAAACFDVFAIEPPVDDGLLNLPNLLATPHIGASAAEARLAMGRAAIAGLTENFVPEPGVLPFD